MRRLVPFALLALVASPAAQLLPRDGRAPIAVRSHRVEALVEDGLARTTVRQTFVSPYARAIETVFVFPVPDGAALVDVAMEVDGQRLEGLLAERQLARRTYDEIVRAERDPALVEQVGDGLFRLSVFPVVPDEQTVVEISWVQPVPTTDGTLRYVYPLATGAPAATTEQDLSITVRLASSVPLTDVRASRDDALVTLVDDGAWIASLETPQATLDEDLVVTARVASPKARVDLRTFRAAEGEDGWFLALVTPPAPEAAELVPRDVVLVLDTSGSMQTDGKIEQAKASALWLIDNLRPTDRVNVIRFSSDVQGFAPAPVAAGPVVREELKRFVEGFEAKGSTALGDALRQATALPADEGRVRTVVLLTDGRPTLGERDPARLIEVARAGGQRGLRVFPFGVGADVDGGLLRGIGAAARGKAELFRPGGEIETRLTAFLARTAAPALADLALTFEGVAVHDVLPNPLPDVYLGEQVAVTGRFRGAGELRASLDAAVGDRRVVVEDGALATAAPAGSPLVAKLYARQKLDRLEEARRLRLGLADDAYFAALDAGAYSTEDEIVAEMIDVSIEHCVQSAYTSFLVLLPEDRRRLDPRDLAALEEAREELEETMPIEEPTLKDAEIDDHDSMWERSEGEPDFSTDSPFDSDAFNDVLGIGGGAGGKFGTRRGGRRNLRADGVAVSLKAALDLWFDRQQRDDGSWNGDVGDTSLAVLTYLGEGHSTTEGAHKARVAEGVKWLRDQQDLGTGQVGPPSVAEPILDHALATQALGEAYYAGRSPLLKRNAQLAARFLETAQRPEGSWYAGDHDPRPVVTTGFALLALAAAKDAELEVDLAVLERGLAWLDGVPVTPESAAARLLAHAVVGNALGQEPSRELVDALALVVVDAPPVWGPDLDLVHVHFATYAVFQVGGEPWRAWEGALRTEVVDRQNRTGDLRGSWDPPNGDRHEATAFATLSLQVYFRYANLVGTR